MLPASNAQTEKRIADRAGATVEFALKRPEFADKFRSYLKELNLS